MNVTEQERSWNESGGREGVVRSSSLKVKYNLRNKDVMVKITLNVDSDKG